MRQPPTARAPRSFLHLDNGENSPENIAMAPIRASLVLQYTHFRMSVGFLASGWPCRCAPRAFTACRRLACP